MRGIRGWLFGEIMGGLKREKDEKKEWDREEERKKEGFEDEWFGYVGVVHVRMQCWQSLFRRIQCVYLMMDLPL